MFYKIMYVERSLSIMLTDVIYNDVFAVSALNNNWICFHKWFNVDNKYINI